LRAAGGKAIHEEGLFAYNTPTFVVMASGTDADYLSSSHNLPLPQFSKNQK
jgi:hypothetical protein